MQSYLFFPTIGKPTRVYNKSATLIDNIFVNWMTDFIQTEKEEVKRKLSNTRQQVLLGLVLAKKLANRAIGLSVFNDIYSLGWVVLEDGKELFAFFRTGGLVSDAKEPAILLQHHPTLLCDHFVERDSQTKTFCWMKQSNSMVCAEEVKK